MGGFKDFLKECRIWNIREVVIVVGLYLLYRLRC